MVISNSLEIFPAKKKVEGNHEGKGGNEETVASKATVLHDRSQRLRSFALSPPASRAKPPILESDRGSAMGSSWTEGPQGGLVTPLVMPEHYPYKKVSISLNVREGGVTLCIEILPTYRFLQVRRREAGPDGRRGKDYVLVVCFVFSLPHSIPWPDPTSLFLPGYSGSLAPLCR